MTRLTKQTRENMVNDLLLRKFDDAGKALAQRSADLFKLIYEDRYDADTRALMAKIKKKFRDAFQHGGTIYTRAPGGMRVAVGSALIGNNPLGWRAKVEHRPFLNGDFNEGRNWTYAECEIAQQLEAFASDQTSLTAEIAAARSEALGALSTITTAKQLAELWPEAMPILGKHIPVPSGSNLPAVQFAALTESFGLTGEPA